MYELQAYEDEMEEAEAIDWEALFERVTGTADAPIYFKQFYPLVDEIADRHAKYIINEAVGVCELFWVDIYLTTRTKIRYLFLRKEEVDLGDDPAGFEIDIKDIAEDVPSSRLSVDEPELVDYLQDDTDAELPRQSASHLPREFVERVVRYLYCCVGFTGWEHDYEVEGRALETYDTP